MLAASAGLEPIVLLTLSSFAYRSLQRVRDPVLEFLE
jgi:hypothetical protein